MSTARRPDLGKRIFYRVCRALTLTPMKVIFWVRVRGRSKVPRTGAFVVAPTHRSLLDIFFTGYITRRRIRFMAKQELYEKQFLAWLFTALGGFPVERGSADRSALRAAQQALEAGEPVAIFPEGTRRHGRDVVDLFDGGAYLATRLGVPIVPVGVGGSEQILASGKTLPRPHRVGIVVGDPIQPPQHETGRVRRQEVTNTTEKVRVELQACFDEALALAGVGTDEAASPSASEVGQHP
ncbi:MAG TPA: lysophospholipid acyltransferase family protein [Acidimicrobiia bacterium]|nr:lysophospholipid acyltransferase family protein [Acidimicrobiia bacterium]